MQREPRELSRRRRWQRLQTTRVSVGARKLQPFTQVSEGDSATCEDSGDFGPIVGCKFQRGTSHGRADALSVLPSRRHSALPSPRR